MSSLQCTDSVWEGERAHHCSYSVWFVPASRGFCQPYPCCVACSVKGRVVSPNATRYGYTYVDKHSLPYTQIHTCSFKYCFNIKHNKRRLWFLYLVFIGSCWEAFWHFICIFLSLRHNFFWHYNIQNLHKDTHTTPGLDSYCPSPRGLTSEITSGTGVKGGGSCSSCTYSIRMQRSLSSR